MSIPVRLGAVAAALFAACTLDLSTKTCMVDSDCLPGDVCIFKQCTAPIGAGGTTGGGGGGGTGGNVGTFDGGQDALPPRMCPTVLVNACPADPGMSCEEIYCGGGPLWRNGVMKNVLVSYRFSDPDNKFSPSYRAAIRASAAAWARASGGFVTFKDCTIFCTGRYISVVPGNGDGINNPEATEEQFLPMPVDSSGRVSPHRIAHQWGHVLGLSHTYERADRDRYIGFDQDVWCPSGGSGLPPHCARGDARPPTLPAVTTGTFGAFDGKSKMNGFRSEGICGAEEPDQDSGEPTIGDVSALAELFFGVQGTWSIVGGWSPFQPIGRSVSPTQPLDYQLAQGVDPIGSPQVAELMYASPEIFVRGTDDRVYTTARTDLSSATAQWLDWTQVADDVDADPAVVFSHLALPETLFLAVRSQQDGQIHLRARRGGDWGGWTSLGAPASSAASGPALASGTPPDGGASGGASSLAVFVRGGDGLIYHLDCPAPDDDCASSSSQLGAWQALPPPSSGIFVGKPSAIWTMDNTGLAVAAIRDDRAVLLITTVEKGGGDWILADNISADLAPDDPDPGVAIAVTAMPGDLAFFARNQHGLLAADTVSTNFASIGGVIASPPGVAAIYPRGVRTDVAAIIDDHGHPGVWWRYNDPEYTAPCNYNDPTTCHKCGL